MKNLGSILGRLLIGVVIIALLLTAGGLFYFKSYLPAQCGTSRNIAAEHATAVTRIAPTNLTASIAV